MRRARLPRRAVIKTPSVSLSLASSLREGAKKYGIVNRETISCRTVKTTIGCPLFFQILIAHIARLEYRFKFLRLLNKFLKNLLTLKTCFDIIITVANGQHRYLREWRNRQTRTFEGRVVIPYGFKSRLSHQKKAQRDALGFFQ